MPLGAIPEAPTFGAHAHSWVRIEDGQLVLLAFRPPVPGDENLLASERIDPRFEDVVRSTVPVVVASRGRSSVTHDGKLAIVPYGEDKITIRRELGERAKMISHYFGGTVTQDETLIQGGWLKVNAVARSAEGKPLEWIEVQIS